MNKKNILIYVFSAFVMIPSIIGCNNKPSPTTSKLASIAVVSPKTNYVVGEAFAKPNVTATYEDQTTKEVSASENCKFTGFDSSKEGTYKIDVSYTESNITKTADYNVTVSKSSGLKFAIFADVQLCNNEIVDKGSSATVNLGTTANAPIALKNHLQYCKKNNISTILMNGDITNQANTYYYAYFNKILKSVYGNDESTYPEFLMNMGNHEWWGGVSEKESSNAVKMFKENARIKSGNLVKESTTTLTSFDNETAPSYYKVINGIPFMVISGENSNGIINTTLKDEIVGWLDEIKKLPSVVSGGPIFVEYHYPLSTSMTHGQGSTGHCATIEDIFKDTPNAVIFTGDTHFPGNNERSINQVNFTNINLGSSSYSRMVNKSAVICDGYYNVQGTGSKIADKLVGNAKYKEAYTPTIQVVDVKADNTFTIDRYFTEDGGTAHSVGKQWKFNPIKAKTDFTYTNARFENKDAAKDLYGAEGLSWDTSDKVIFGVNETTKQMTVRFPDVKEHHFVEHYKIEVTAEDTNTSKSYDLVSNYYKYPENRENNYYILSEVPESSKGYTVTVTAYDFYDNPSLNTLSSSTNDTTVTADSIDNQSTLTYCDIQTRVNFDEKYDNNSHSSVEYYYKGIQNYSTGAIANRVYLKEDTNPSCKSYISLQDDDECTPTVVARIKNPNKSNVTVGLSVVKDDNGEEKWIDDFDKTRQTVKPGDWSLIGWDLSNYGITSRSQIKNISLKFKLDNASSDGYEMGLLIDNLDIQKTSPFPRGQRISEGNLTYDIAQKEAKSITEELKLDFKFDETQSVAGATKFRFIIGCCVDGGKEETGPWKNYFGYYSLYNDGTLKDRNDNTPKEFTVSKLPDGFIRVSVVPNNIDNNQIGEGNPKVEGAKVRLIYLKPGSDESKASGYVDINPSK